MRPTSTRNIRASGNNHEFSLFPGKPFIARCIWRSGLPWGTKWSRSLLTILVVALVLCLGGCTSIPYEDRTDSYRGPADYDRAGLTEAYEIAMHTVEKGETVYSIARMYGVSPETLIRANRLSRPSEIEAGDMLIIPLSPAAREKYCDESITESTVTSEAKPQSYNVGKGFIWPARGEILCGYGQPQLVNGIPDRNKGVNIRVRHGEKIVAARGGIIRFVSDNYPGWGRVVIIDHGSGLFSFYAYNSAVLVKAGESVSQGDVIAEGGQSGRAKIPQLHFRIIRDGKPVDPAQYLVDSR